MTENELVTALKQGKEEAFDRFFQTYKNTIYNFGMKFCGNPEDAGDILQETLINAFKYIKNFKGDSKLSTWLYRIASNACLMKKKKKQNADFSIHDFDEERSDFGQRNGYHPLKELEKKELEKAVQKAILKLPENYRIPFILKEIENLSHDEIAEILDTTVSNAKVRVHRARLMLKDMVSSYLKGEKNDL